MIKAGVSMFLITFIIVILPIGLPPMIPHWILNNVILVTLLRVPIIITIIILAWVFVQDVKKK